MMLHRAYDLLRAWADSRADLDWLHPLIDQSIARLSGDSHGDLPAWRSALSDLPDVSDFFDGHRPAPILGGRPDHKVELEPLLMALHPWRKGPLEIAGCRIDTEWRSDWKWARIAPHIDLHGKTVLDIGSGNGYYGWRMLGSGAKRVVGIDPTLVFVMQWLAAHHCAGDVSNWVLPLGVDQLPRESRSFDAVFSMGVLYHRKNPIDHLRHLRRLLRPRGELVLETLVLNDPGVEQLNPDGRYARMRNVWSVPSLPLLEQWLEEAGLPGAQLLDVSTTTTAEQRSTAWMHFESLEQCLDPRHPERTIEGYPSPTRAALMVKLN